MKTRTGIALLGLLAASCSTSMRSDLQIIKVVEAAAPAGGGTCAFDPTANEKTLSAINPATNLGQVAAVVQNNLLDTSTLNPGLRTNTAQFQPHQLVISYEVFPRAGTTAAPYTIPSQLVAVGGLTVQTGEQGTIGGAFFLPGVLPAGAANGDVIRVTF
ncbi:MAG TPA: hypothetical protein VMK66_03675, partial [Myxococcales bacterium]|nr:hypothetical protein [Myxococcales bacterium]